MFHVGQKVVCVDDTCHYPQWPQLWDAALKDGQVYCIRWIGEFAHRTPNGRLPPALCVRLVGVDRIHAVAPDWPFYARRFRPVVERKEARKTSIEVFKKMLTPSKITEKV